jgi:hypothetical protein
MQWFDWFDRIVEGIIEIVTSLSHCPFSNVLLNCSHRSLVVKVISSTSRVPQFFGNCMGM